MSKQILKDLPELVAAGIISEALSEQIRVYYVQRSQQSPNRLVLVFGMLGALLVGLGIVLIIAHNWDEFSRVTKLFFALLPLVLAQLICAFTLLRKPDSRLWRESGAVFLFFAISASISIVSQVYHIPGNMAAFLFIWMWLSIPIIYVMRSAMVSLLVIGGVTWYACILSYFDYPTEIAWYYWVMVAAIVPFFIALMRKGRGNFFHFHTWFLALSIIIALGMFNQADSFFMFVGYMSLFSLWIMVGETGWFGQAKIAGNAFLVTGSLGSAILLLLFSFRFIWTEIAREPVQIDDGFLVSVIVSFLAGAMLVYSVGRRGMMAVNPNSYLFLIFILLFAVGRFQPGLVQWLTNALVLIMAVLTTWRGAERDNIFLLNYGLVIMTALILCRFFDTDLSFVVRGVLFVAVGLSFFVANYWVLRRRKLQRV